MKMSRPDDCDMDDFFVFTDSLPVPKWDLANTWIESRGETEKELYLLWNDFLRRWLVLLAPALGDKYEWGESGNFLALGWGPDGLIAPTLDLAERCGLVLLDAMKGVTEVSLPGKQVFLLLRSPEDYYRYISLFFPEGNHTSSVGLHIGEGYSHIVILGKKMEFVDSTVAHELTHAFFHHLNLPRWLDEGLAQMFEHDVTGKSNRLVDSSMAQRHKKYWGKKGLDGFWDGESFNRPGDSTNFCYELAEILVRLLVERSRPRWFGWVKEPQIRFRAFLKNARFEDGGQESAVENLGLDLGDLAGQFLGEGTWSPSP